MAGEHWADANRRMALGQLALKEVKSQEKAPKIGAGLFLVLDILLSASLLLTGAGAGSWIVILVIDILCIMATVILFRRNRARKVLKEDLRGGQFQVTPCFISNVDFNANLTYGWEVELTDVSGKIIKKKIVADFVTVNAWKEDRGLLCYLIQDQYGSDMTYERLYSENQLQIG